MKRDWEILLIGGSAGTGKTTLARQLSLHFQVPYFEVDDIRLVMQRTMQKADDPVLFSFLTAEKSYFDSTPHKQIAGQLYKISRAVWKGLRAVVELHLQQKKPIIIEGDGIVPELLEEFAGAKIKAVFLYDDKEALYKRELQREKEGDNRPYEVSGRDTANPDKWRERYTSVAYLYGQMIQKQAEQHNYPTCKSSPIETLYSRILDELNK